MDGNDARLTIGELARRTGLSVKTIRWSARAQGGDMVVHWAPA